jgi:hypothetical protein
LLQKAVLAGLNWEPSLDGACIGVTAENGVVSLMVHVVTYGQIRAAETAIDKDIVIVSTEPSALLWPAGRAAP